MTEKTRGDSREIIKRLVRIAYDYLSINSDKDDKGFPIFTGDLLFILPSVKKSISLYSAILDDVSNKRLLSATILSRSLIEVVVTILYVANIKKDEGFYEKFMQHGRLRIKRTGKGWQNVTIASQIKWVEDTYRITRIQDVYDNCSKLVHFSDSAAQLILDRRKEKDNGEISILIGENESQFPQTNFDALIDTCEGMLAVLSVYLEAVAKGKRLQASIITDVEPDIS